MIRPGGTRNKSSPIFLLDKWLIRKVKKLAHAPAAAEIYMKGSKNTKRVDQHLALCLCGFSRKRNWMCWLWHSLTYTTLGCFKWGKYWVPPDCTNSMRTHKCIWQFHTCIHLLGAFVCFDREARSPCTCSQGFMNVSLWSHTHQASALRCAPWRRKFEHALQRADPQGAAEAHNGNYCQLGHTKYCDF